ncbi:hypothetical protein OAF63_04505 [Saprospiraceae bacterium]|nr:hypothetical protein [Bacteroidota bacterium]MDB4728033.1 hypothetical protein [Saprospiraceae bacterium]MDF1865567.1 hypothetical protein [Saprospiraceae bacterium]
MSTSKSCYDLEVLYSNLTLESTPLKTDYDKLGGRIFKFIEYVENNWRT